MRQLQQEGLISAGPRGRLSVRHLDAKEIRDIFDVRAALESLAARTLANRSDREEVVAVLRKAVTEMERRVEAHLDDRIEADLKFHRTMCQLSGSETLLHSWSSLEGSIRMSIMFAGVDRALKNMDSKRHSDIVDAIASGDADKAAATINDHMAGASHVLVDGSA
jgi:DNA-binding GntR family transcriptional regulator